MHALVVVYHLLVKRKCVRVLVLFVNRKIEEHKKKTKERNFFNRKEYQQLEEINVHVGYFG